jgi:chromate transporter
MVLFAYGVAWRGDPGQTGWLHGLKLVAVAVVAQAVWGMARSLCPDRARATLAVLAIMFTLALPGAAGQVGAIALGALAGFFVLPRPNMNDLDGTVFRAPVSHHAAVLLIAVFFALLLGLPMLDAAIGSATENTFSAFYRAGALVFGGGHVVLPLLQDSVVGAGWVDQNSFLAGYGAAQAVPGPLFTFAAYLGAARIFPPNGVAGAALALVAIFLPSFLLVPGALPAWGALRRRAGAQAALRGVNAVVVGLLASALYSPVWTSAVFRPADFAVCVAAFLLLTGWAVAPWIVVALGAAAGWALG